MNPELTLAATPRARSVRDLVLALRSQPMLAGLDDDGLLLMAEHGQSSLYRDGEVISVEGEPTRSVHLIKSGCIAVSRQGEPLPRALPGKRTAGCRSWRVSRPCLRSPSATPRRSSYRRPFSKAR